VTRKKLRRGSDRKSIIVKEILAARVDFAPLSSRQQVRRFLEQYVANVPVEDLEGRSTRTMARIALSHLEFGAGRRSGQARLRIYNPTEEEHGYASAYTFVEMVNDDMPFLVNSVSAAINRHDLSVHITVHPIIRVQRNADGKITDICRPDSEKGRPESFIRLAVDRETDPQEIKLLEQEIRSVLSDIRLAVRDWKKMRDKIVETRELLNLGPRRADEVLRSESREFLQWLADDHFTFLGYRETHHSQQQRLPQANKGQRPWSAVPPGARWTHNRADRGNAPPETLPGLADSDQGQFALDGTPQRLPRLRWRKSLRRERRGLRRTTLYRPVRLCGIQ
jgi:glutamate dehydrogenase